MRRQLRDDASDASSTADYNFYKSVASDPANVNALYTSTGTTPAGATQNKAMGVFKKLVSGGLKMITGGGNKSVAPPPPAPIKKDYTPIILGGVLVGGLSLILINKQMKKKRAKRRPLSSAAGLSKRVKHHHPRRRPRKKGMLSEIFDKTTATNSAKNTLSGVIGGYGYGIVSKSTAGLSTLEQGAIAVGLSFLAGSVLKMPAIAAGVAGAYGFDLASRGVLHEMQDHEYSKGLEAMPEYMDEMGEPMFLAGDGELYYLHEMDEMNEMNEMNEPTYLADMYPDYVNVSHY